MKVMLKILLGLLRGYRLLVSPWLGSNCRFYPSCSEYATQALQKFGVWHGSWLALRRLMRCHPWQPGGVDLVPEITMPTQHGACHHGRSLK